MFAVVDYDEEDTDKEPFDWITNLDSEHPEEVEWNQTDTIPWPMLGGEDATGGGGNRIAEAPRSPENGPINAIVFEIDKQREGRR